MSIHVINKFLNGTHNMMDDEVIPADAAKDSLNWFTLDGVIEISRGREIVGDEGTAGKIYNEWFGYDVQGNKIHYRKADTKVQVLVGSTWTDVITGLTETARFSFTNYSSLSGAFTFFSGVDGIWKINNANPTTAKDMYSSSVNFKGRMIIDKARSLMWDTPTDKTGLYGSYIDAQDSTVYTTVTNEVLGTGDGIQTVFSGTFAQIFQYRNCFGISINTNPSSVTATDNYMGVISGTGITGTINYMTGAYSLTFSSPPGVGVQVRATYQYEDSNNGGVTDFRKSSTRLAGEGFILRQDEGGDPIMQVLVAPDGSYISLKQQSAYQYIPDPSDLSPTNQVYRKDIGVSSYQSGVSTGFGVIFMNTANPLKPQLTILEKNPLGDNLLPKILFPQYKFENFYYDEDTVVDYFGQHVVICAKSNPDNENDVMLMGNIQQKAIERTGYSVNCVAKDGNYLYGGSPFEKTTYKIFTGYDDLGDVLENYWKSKGEYYKDNEHLHKFRKIRLKGLIDKSQWYEVYVSYDDQSYQLVGTIRGDADYVDYTNPLLVGVNLVGEADIGGVGGTTVYPYFTEIKVKTPKFRKRSIMFVAKGIGYVNIQQVQDWDIMLFENRLPSRFRQKQFVSLDGTQTDLPNPEF